MKEEKRDKIRKEFLWMYADALLEAVSRMKEDLIGKAALIRSAVDVTHEPRKKREEMDELEEVTDLLVRATLCEALAMIVRGGVAGEHESEAKELIAQIMEKMDKTFFTKPTSKFWK